MKPEQMLKLAQESFDSLASKDIAQVAKTWLGELEGYVRENPIQALLGAATIGAGLTTLRGEQLRSGAYRFAKLMALKALAGFEPGGKEHSREVA